MDALKQYDFPGNVRELKHLIEFGCAQTQNGTEVDASCLTHRLVSLNAEIGAVSAPVTNIPTENDGSFEVISDLKQALNEFESKIISQRLKVFSGDRAKAAESLGIPKRTLAYKCQKLEIKA